MSKNIVWSHTLRVRLFNAVITQLGLPYDVPRGGRGKPIGMSKSEYISTLDDIGVAIGVGPGKGGALSNQIAWAYCTPSANCHAGHWNNCEKNLAAAAEAGYFTTRVTKTPYIKPIPIEHTNIKTTSPSKGVFSRMWSSIKSWFS